jgi:SanA protein
MKYYLHIAWLVVSRGTAFLFVTITLIFLLVNIEASRFVKDDIDNLDPAHTAIVLGAMVKENGTLSLPLKDRVDTAIALYRAGKVDRILVSGDDGTVNYNEVNPSRDYLLERGVPSSVIFLDHAGFDTYSSMYRARDIFLVDTAIIVTQSFHLPRAVFIARRLGLDAQGMTADKRDYHVRNYMREVLADVKAVANLIFHRKPKYLGEEIPITGSPKESI